MKKYLPLIFYITLFLLILGFSISAKTYDFDLWARLIAGMGVIDGHKVLMTDFLSYTPTHVWYDHEWGSGVIFYSFLKLFGGYSLIILQSILIFLIFFTINKILILKKVANPYNFLFYFFAVMSLMPTLNNPIRCHLFSFLLFCVFLFILEKSREQNWKILCFLPLITIFWNNIHGGIVSGLGLIILFAVGEFLNRKPFKQYIYAFFISSSMLLLNPWGIKYIKFLFMANTMVRADVAEWWGIFSKHQIGNFLVFKFLMFLIIVVEVYQIVLKVKKLGLKNFYVQEDKVKWVVLLSTLYLAISHVKLMPFFVITVTCYCYQDFYKTFEFINFPNWKDKVIYISIITLSLFSLIAKNLTVPVDFGIYPIKEIEFVKKNDLKGNLLINFGLGSYAAYKLYPNNKIFMDGRYEEVYYDDMIPMLKRFYLVLPGWDDVLIDYKPDVMIIEKYYPVFVMLNHTKEWKLVYTGKNFGVFIPSVNLKKSYKMPTDDINYYKKTLFDTNIKFKR